MIIASVFKNMFLNKKMFLINKRDGKMKTEYAILAVFFWLISGLLFLFSYANTWEFTKGADIWFFPSIGFFIIGFIIFLNGVKDPSITSIICPQCGARMESDANYCLKCGTKLR